MNENKALLYQYSQAAEVIKTAILLDSSSTLHASNSTIVIVDMEDLINESAISLTSQS
ncbi:MAG: hypothetical protein U0K53_07290 [Paludibacteraceae bacterium]|nr:hypothetical protein [Paludibacteraceae bacterium]